MAGKGKNMKEKEKKEMLQAYRRDLKKFGQGHKVFHWKNEESQKIRFKVLAEAINKQDLKSVNTSILDVGCGFADFYAYLKKLGFVGKYMGTEIISEFVQAAQKRFPEIEVLTQDIYKKPLKEKFDYVIANGIMNHKIENIGQYQRELIKIMFGQAKKCLAFNLASKYRKIKKESSRIHYADPAEYFSYSMSLSPKVILRHDYLLRDFAIFVYR